MNARLPRLTMLAAAAVVLALAAQAASPPTLGRLFLTPEQRRMLDAQRTRRASQGDSFLPRDLLPARSAPERRVILSGVLRRGRGGDGGPVVWINGRKVDAATLARNRIRLRHGPDADNRVTLQSGEDGAVARLKPGQAWDPVDRSVSDCLGCSAPAGTRATP